jgi:hypothetical protein
MAAAALAVGGTVTAVAVGQTSPPATVRISTPETTTYKLNQFAQIGLRWNENTYTISSGGTLSFNNLQTDEPHTFSVVTPSQLPTTTAQINNCMALPPALPKYAPCANLYKAHAPNAQGTGVAHPVVNTGKTGIDGPGDSVFIPPKGAGPQPTIKVTAAKGTTLSFFCLVHPWMQAKLQVK